MYNNNNIINEKLPTFTYEWSHCAGLNLYNLYACRELSPFASYMNILYIYTYAFPMIFILHQHKSDFPLPPRRCRRRPKYEKKCALFTRY